MPQSLKKRAAELERLVNERAEVVKRVLKEYRETARATASQAKGRARSGERQRLLKKRLDVERANDEYIRLRKELDKLRAQMQLRNNRA